jgi:hypothetical protein
MIVAMGVLLGPGTTVPQPQDATARVHALKAEVLDALDRHAYAEGTLTCPRLGIHGL